MWYTMKSVPSVPAIPEECIHLLEPNIFNETSSETPSSLSSFSPRSKEKGKMSRPSRFLTVLITTFLICCILAWLLVPKPGSSQFVEPSQGTCPPLQDIVTWDKHSPIVRGERVMLYSGEFHPYRLPVPDLWIDVLQKIKVLGFSAVSFYTNWALLEGREGNFSAEGIFALEPFFDAASEAGIYLIARPGPYIGAESSGGGIPGWLQRKKAMMRTSAYLPFTENYVKNVASIIAKAQITNGGPVILLQPENEYSRATSDVDFPNREYFAAVEQQYRDAGIVVPLISNDDLPKGYFAPGTGLGAVDIYGHDRYPLEFDCVDPSLWPDNRFPTNDNALHQQQSPSTPFAIMEFQAGSFDPWGGSTFNSCAKRTNEEFERVFYKNNYAAGIKILNLYMIYGGTNWGNSGHPRGYTSYDYGAAIPEDRTISRVKYHEIKLQANFLKVSPAYLTAVPENAGNASYTDTHAIFVSRLVGNKTSFYVVRHTMFNSLVNTSYRLRVPTSIGEMDIPRLSNSLTLNGRDSKIHVTDYDVADTVLLYCTAEIFTWKKYTHKTVLVLYGGLNETHELAFTNVTFREEEALEFIEGGELKTTTIGDMLVLNWVVTLHRKVVRVGENLFVYLLDRTDAYNYWVLDLPGPPPFHKFTTPNAMSIIARMSFYQWNSNIRPGYLLRTASIDWLGTVYLTGDLNETSVIEVIGGIPSGGSRLIFNSRVISLHIRDRRNGILGGFIPFFGQKFTPPDLNNLAWKYIDSLPEILPSYDDSAWPSANLTSSNNTVRNLTTPSSLYGSDYGFNTGNLLFRGRFTATGSEKFFQIETQGGTAFAVSVFLDQTLLGSFPGNSAQSASNLTLTLPSLTPKTEHILTVLLDNMGLDDDNFVGTDGNKNPRGILNYSLLPLPQIAIIWKVTGNLGGEAYRDLARGPLNEGGLYAERQGYHLPNLPLTNWVRRKPTDGINSAGVGFFATSFKLDVPTSFVGGPVRYDIPLSFVFTNTTTGSSTVANYRVQLYVNGYQFGKYINNVGPQTAFPVPEGVLNYHGVNWIGLSLWAMGEEGARVEGLELVATAVVQTGRGEVGLVPMTAWEKREGAY